MWLGERRARPATGCLVCYGAGRAAVGAAGASGLPRDAFTADRAFSQSSRLRRTALERAVPGCGREPGVSRLAGGGDSAGDERAGNVGVHQRGVAAGCRYARRARRHRPGRQPAVACAAARPITPVFRIRRAAQSTPTRSPDRHQLQAPDNSALLWQTRTCRFS